MRRPLASLLLCALVLQATAAAHALGARAWPFVLMLCLSLLPLFPRRKQLRRYMRRRTDEQIQIN